MRPGTRAPRRSGTRKTTGKCCARCANGKSAAGCLTFGPDSFMGSAYAIQHRKTGCWLSVEPTGRDCYLRPCDSRHATRFPSQAAALVAAEKFQLTPQNFKIHEMQTDLQRKNLR